jgi:hypothetical protein
LRRHIFAIVGAVFILCGTASASVAAAATAPKGGAIKVFVKPSPTGTGAKHPGKVVITGAVGDYGTSESVTAAGKPSKKGAYKLLTLKKGTILVNGTLLNAALTSAQPTANSTNCSFVFSASAPVTFVKGTGAYVGISGSVTITLTFAAILPKTKAGKCTEKTATQPLASTTSVMGTGTVTFPS